MTLSGSGRALAFAAVALAGLVPAGSALAAGRGHAAATTLTVTLTDKRLSISPRGAQAGAATLHVVNRGTKPHALVLSGPGLKRARTGSIPAGRSATLKVTLRTGAYVVADSTSAAPASTGYLMVTPPPAPSSNVRVVTPMPTETPGMYCD